MFIQGKGSRHTGSPPTPDFPMTINTEETGSWTVGRRMNDPGDLSGACELAETRSPQAGGWSFLGAGWGGAALQEDLVLS